MMRGFLIALGTVSMISAGDATAQTRRARATPVCPPDCAAARGYQTYTPADTPWPIQAPVASGSYGAMLEGRNPASSAGF